MIYDQQTTHLIQLIDAILLDYHIPSLLDTDTFKVYEDLHDEGYVRFDLVSQDTIELIFWLERGDLRIDIDRTSEMYEWSQKSLKKDTDSLKNILKIILTSTIKIRALSIVVKTIQRFIILIARAKSLLQQRINLVFSLCFALVGLIVQKKFMHPFVLY